jgi:membrane-associated phospholipid phosphatase
MSLEAPAATGGGGMRVGVAPMPLPAPVLPYLGPDGRARPLAVVVHYVVDWLSLIALAIVLLAVEHGVGVTAREYSTETVAGSNGLVYLQQAQAYEYVPDTVSMAVCAVVAIAVPIAVCLLVQPCAKLGDKSWYERSAFLDVLHFVLGLGEAIVCSTLVVELSKKYVGRLRPSAFVRMASPALPQDWNQSWPSGHSATAFCELGYLALYLSGKLGIFSGGGSGRASRRAAGTSSAAPSRSCSSPWGCPSGRPS